MKTHCNDCQYDVIGTCESGYYFHDKPIHSTDVILSVTSSMRQSPKLLHSLSEGSNTIIPIKRLQCKRTYLDPEDSVNFLDYCG